VTDDLSRRGFLQATGAAAAAATVGRADAADVEISKLDQVFVGVSAAADSLRGPVEDTLPESAAILETNRAIRYVTVQFPPDTSTAIEHDYVQTAEAHEMVRYAERNRQRRRNLAPNDPLRSEQEPLDLINANAAFDTTKGSSDVRVAVIDTGVDYNHEDLAPNVRDDPGKDFVGDGDDDPIFEIDPDTNGLPQYHGTQVAGIIGAVTDNGKGVTGLSQSELIFGRSLSASGPGTTGDVAEGIIWAANQNADIINLSLGSTSASLVEENAVEYATNQGSLLVAGAGNSQDESVIFPAGYDEVVAVSAVTPERDLASFTNTGDQVELAAPGTNYESTYPNDQYFDFSGTSAASPCVAGVAALVMSEHGTDRLATRKHLRATANNTNFSSYEEGAGIVDAQAAVEATPGTLPVPKGPNSVGGPGSRETTATVSGSLSGFDDSDCYAYSFSFDNPTFVDVELTGDAGTDFDLYVDDGEADCPTNDTAAKRFVSTDSNERLEVRNPDTSTRLYVTVDSYAGSGSYTLRLTEVL